MEFRVYNLIKQFGNWRKESDIELIYEALTEAINLDDETPNETIVDTITDLVKCDCCGEYEIEYFTTFTSLVLDEDGEHGRICDYCRSIG